MTEYSFILVSPHPLFFFFFCSMGVKFRAWYMLGKCTIIEYTPITLLDYWNILFRHVFSSYFLVH